MKKFTILALALICALGITFGVSTMPLSASAEVVEGETPSFTSTKVLRSKDGDYMLIATGIKDYGDVYKVGYDFTGYTTGGTDVTYATKYYTSVNGKTAEDIFGDDTFEAMIIWEIKVADLERDGEMTVQAYAYVGSRDDGVLVYDPEDEVKAQGTALTVAAHPYKITWYDEDGETVLKKTYVKEGDVPEYPAADPTKSATTEKVYAFDGWDVTPIAATEDAEYTATYSESARPYTITWLNADGSELTTTEVPYGSIPSYTGSTPTKESSVSTVYTHNGWSPTIEEVKGNATYTATYGESVREYTITWLDENSNEITHGDLAYGSTPTPPSVDELSNKITTWSPAVTEVGGTATYTLVYKNLTYAGEIWDFDDSSIVAGDMKESAGGSYYVDYLESYDGETGVVAITNTRTGDWNWYIRFLSGYRAFATSLNENADTLFIRIKASEACKSTMYAADADVGASLIMYEYSLPTSWTTIAITGENFNHFKDYLAYYRGAICAWLSNPVTVYISDIYVGTSATVTNNGVKADGNVITLDDNSATVFSGYRKLDLEVRGPDNSVVTVTNGKFTASSEGTYTVTYKALMSNGVVKTASYTVDGTPVRKSGEIWNFNDSSIVANDVKESAGRNYYVDYLESYDGETGVVAVTNTVSNWNWDVWFLSGYTAFVTSLNENADTLFIRIKASASCRTTMFGAGADVGASLILYEYYIPTTWTTLAISGDNFNHFKDYLAYYRGAIRAWIESPVTIYVSDIYVGTSATVTNNGGSIIVGEVTLNDNSETVFAGYDKLDLEVKAPDNTVVTVTNGKFTPTVNGVYKVTYYAHMPSGLVKVGSYTITCFKKNDLGTFTPSAADWLQQGGSTFTSNVVDGYAEHITNVDTAAYTNFSSVRNYMAANSISTVKIRFDFISGGRISIGKISGGVNNFEFGDTDGSGRYFAAGDSYELTFNLSDYDRVYCQIIWTACEFVVTYEFIS